MNASRMRKSAAMDVVIDRDGKRCFYCRRVTQRLRRSRGGKLPSDTATLDHVIPKSEGGSNDTENLVLACTECNRRRGTCDFIVFGIKSIVDIIRSKAK